MNTEKSALEDAVSERKFLVPRALNRQKNVSAYRSETQFYSLSIILFLKKLMELYKIYNCPCNFRLLKSLRF